MAYSITDALFDFMQRRRIITAVAHQMGVCETTLSAELRRQKTQAKLGADNLIPLLNAIRAIGYESELRGILFRFIKELKGEELYSTADDDLIPQLLKLTAGLGIICECAASVPRIADEAELRRIRNMLRSEILPALLKMDDTVERRLSALRGRNGKLADVVAAVLNPPAPETT